MTCGYNHDTNCPSFEQVFVVQRLLLSEMDLHTTDTTNLPKQTEEEPNNLRTKLTIAEIEVELWQIAHCYDVSDQVSRETQRWNSSLIEFQAERERLQPGKHSLLVEPLRLQAAFTTDTRPDSEILDEKPSGRGDFVDKKHIDGQRKTELLSLIDVLVDDAWAGEIDGTQMPGMMPVSLLYPPPLHLRNCASVTPARLSLQAPFNSLPPLPSTLQGQGRCYENPTTENGSRQGMDVVLSRSRFTSPCYGKEGTKPWHSNLLGNRQQRLQSEIPDHGSSTSKFTLQYSQSTPSSPPRRTYRSTGKHETLVGLLSLTSTPGCLVDGGGKIKPTTSPFSGQVLMGEAWPVGHGGLMTLLPKRALVSTEVATEKQAYPGELVSITHSSPEELGAGSNADFHAGNIQHLRTIVHTPSAAGFHKPPLSLTAFRERLRKFTNPSQHAARSGVSELSCSGLSNQHFAGRLRPQVTVNKPQHLTGPPRSASGPTICRSGLSSPELRRFLYNKPLPQSPGKGPNASKGSARPKNVRTSYTGTHPTTTTDASDSPITKSFESEPGTVHLKNQVLAEQIIGQGPHKLPRTRPLPVLDVHKQSEGMTKDDSKEIQEPEARPFIFLSATTTRTASGTYLTSIPRVHRQRHDTNPLLQPTAKMMETRLGTQNDPLRAELRSFVLSTPTFLQHPPSIPQSTLNAAATVSSAAGLKRSKSLFTKKPLKSRPTTPTADGDSPPISRWSPDSPPESKFRKIKRVLSISKLRRQGSKVLKHRPESEAEDTGNGRWNFAGTSSGTLSK
jgi:hypothetical protein